jgi:hypothetical protein
LHQIVFCIYFIDTVTYDDVLVPAQPQEVTLVGSTVDSITIEWQQDGLSSEYYFEVDKVEYISVTSSPTDDSRIMAVIEGLGIAGEQYSISIMASNGYFNSSSSAAFLARTSRFPINSNGSIPLAIGLHCDKN